MAERVLLLHGIWMVGSTLRLLARRLAAAGFAPERFGYPSVFGGPGPSIDRLATRLRSRAGDDAVHLVGHSLGGLIALETVRRSPALPPGRVVCLGSPLAGSAAARGLARFPFGPRLAGRSHALLVTGIAPWRGPREVGVIAGSKPIGLGAVFHHLPRPHDGTVAVCETRIEGLTDHCVLPVTHTGMLLSFAVAERTVAFLRHGRFDPA